MWEDALYNERVPDEGIQYHKLSVSQCTIIHSHYLHSEKDILKLVNTIDCQYQGGGQKSAETISG